MFNFLKSYGYFRITNCLSTKLTFRRIIFAGWIIFTFTTCSFLRNLIVDYFYGLNNCFVFFLFSIGDFLNFTKKVFTCYYNFNWLNSRNFDYTTYTIFIHLNVFFKNIFLFNSNYIITFYLNMILTYKVYIFNTMFNYIIWLIGCLDHYYYYFSSNSFRCNNKYYILFIFIFFIVLFLFVELKKISTLLHTKFVKNRYYSRRVNFLNTKYTHFFKKK